MTKKYFGTDGIRGEVGQYPITADFMMHLGWAAGQVLLDSSGSNRVLIGKDTRVSGYMFESALQAGLIAAGAEVGLLGPMPTPAIAYLTRTFNAAAGIVISASHNPYQDNGIKFFCSEGYKLPDETELEIEKHLDQSIQTLSSDKLGKAFRIADAAGRYIEYCKSTVPRGLNLSSMRVVVDCGNGATYHIAPKVFSELGADVISLGTNPDGFNINKDRGSTSPQRLQETVFEEGADLGIAFDGDGDRLIMVDRHGQLVDGDQLLYLIAKFRQATDGCLGVVGTLMTNLAVEKQLQELGIGFERAQVGDRYVMEMMRNKGYFLGGESSGHIICSDRTTTGDGVVSALQVLAACQHFGLPLDESISEVVMFPQVLLNVQTQNKPDLQSHSEIEEAVSSAQKELADQGRILLRPSGTEPVIRVMVEGQDADLVSTLAKQVASVVEKVVAA
jgi:phosphoglucosamine mutase